MQEELEQKSVAISIKAGKLTAKSLEESRGKGPGGNGKKARKTRKSIKASRV